MSEKGKGVMLTHEDIHAHNTFEEPENVHTSEMEIKTGDVLKVPKASVIALEI